MAFWSKLIGTWQESRRSKAINRAMRRGDAAEVERLMRSSPGYGSEWVYGAVSPLHKTVMAFDMETETFVEGDLNALRQLIAEGANLELKDEYGQTALLLASSNGLINAARLLLESGANTNAKNDIGQTSYEVAVENGYAEVASLLRRFGTDAGTPDGLTKHCT